MLVTDSFDIVITGGGIVGLSAAFELSSTRPDLRICVVAPAQDSASASQAAGAMLGVYGEITEFGLRTRPGQYKHHLTRSAASLWSNWAQRVAGLAGRDDFSLGRGTFLILNHLSSRLDESNFSAAVAAAESESAAYEEVDPGEIPGLDPVDPGRPARAVYFGSEGWVPARDYLSMLQVALARLENVTIMRDRVSSINSAGGVVRGVELSHTRTISCGAVVVAAGTSSSALLASAYGQHPPIPLILAGTGSSLLVAPLEPACVHVIRTPNRSFSCGLHVVPSGSGLYVGATNNINLKPSDAPPLNDISFLIDCAVDQVNHQLEHAALLEVAVGNRPVSIDTYPLLGPTSIHGLFVMTATYRDGFHLSPLLARAAAGWLEGESRYPELQTFAPERTPLSVCSREDAISQAVAYYLAVGSEHRMRLPRVGWEEMLSELIVKKVETLYADLDTERVLHPDLVSVVDRDRRRLVPLFRAELNGERGDMV